MVNVSRLRYWFAVATVLVILVVAGFYLYARYRFLRAVKEVPAKLGLEIQQSTETFSLSKSEGGRTLFTIRASKAVQFKQGGRAELHDVNIIVYGRESDRFDQIYGDDFEYDQQTGNVVAKGVVHIDLEANPEPGLSPGLALPKELKNPVHLKTSGLVFNQKSGIAETEEEISFQIPQANGSAKGAHYDSKSNTLTLTSAISIQTTGPNATKMAAHHGVITNEPRRAVLDRVVVVRGQSKVTATKATLFLRPDNSLERVMAEGDVQAFATGETGISAHAPRADFSLSDKNEVKSAVMSGGVVFNTTGANQIDGTAGRVVADFGDEAKLKVVHATDNVDIRQLPSSAPRNGMKGAAKSQKDTVAVAAKAMDFFVKNGEVLERAETIGAGQITIAPTDPTANSRPTMMTAGKIRARFNGNRLVAVRGDSEARVVQSAPGQPDRVSTSDTVEALFDNSGTISGFAQQGHFEYREGETGGTASRAASAAKATYNNASQVLLLEGTPRVVDGGMATTAEVVKLNRATGDAEARSNVKTTYSEVKPAANGALLAGGDPIHVTADNMTFVKAAGTAQYTGGARLWQGANIIEAPSIDFTREQRSLVARSNRSKRVAVVLVQQEKGGKVTPVNVTATRLTYTDQQRLATFDGNVVIRSSDGTVLADHVDVHLKAHESTAAGAKTLPGANASELDRIVAEGHVNLQQPNRRGSGQKLVYTADDAKFVLTGGPPVINDAEHGTVTGSALTFYSRDDRVLVEGGGPSRAITKTRVSK